MHQTQNKRKSGGKKKEFHYMIHTCVRDIMTIIIEICVLRCMGMYDERPTLIIYFLQICLVL